MTFRIPFSYDKLKVVGTKVHPFGTSIKEFELSFLISGSLKDRETDLVNLPFTIFRFHFSFSCKTGKQYAEDRALAYCQCNSQNRSNFQLRLMKSQKRSVTSQRLENLKDCPCRFFSVSELSVCRSILRNTLWCV